MIETDVKIEADNIFRRLGMTTDDAIKIFLNQVILRGGLPFDVRVPIPNETTKSAMHDAKNDISLHKFESVDDMFRALEISKIKTIT